MTESLFVYGTLRDVEIRERVLGRCPAPREAVLPGYVLRHADGFYFVRPCKAARVRGDLIALSHAQLLRADAWEEAPTLYRRVRCRARLEGAADDVVEHDAWVYVRDDVEGEPVDRPDIAVHDRATVLGMLDGAGDR